MKITTKTGDKGETRLYGGRRVHKSSAYIDMLGSFDELHSYLGWAKLVVSKDVHPILTRVQGDIYRMMSIVGYEMKCPKSIKQITEWDLLPKDNFAGPFIPFPVNSLEELIEWQLEEVENNILDNHGN